jgi:hypothetical protein
MMHSEIRDKHTYIHPSENDIDTVEALLRLTTQNPFNNQLKPDKRLASSACRGRPPTHRHEIGHEKYNNSYTIHQK